MQGYLTTYLFQVGFFSAIHIFFYIQGIRNLVTTGRFFKTIFLSVIVLQLLMSAFLKSEVGDVMLFSGAGYYYRYGVDFYFIDQFHTQYPFFPFLIFLHALLNLIQETLPLLTFSFYLKIVLTGCLLGLVRAISLYRKSSQPLDKVAILKFITHPLTTMVVYFHGQVDIVLLFFLVWSLILLFDRDQNWKNWGMGVAAFTASIAAKTWSVIFLPWILYREQSWLKRILLPLAVGVGLLADVFIYTRTVSGSSISTVLPAVLKPGGPIGDWGTSFIFSRYAEVMQEHNLLFFALPFSIFALGMYVNTILEPDILWFPIRIVGFSVWLTVFGWWVTLLQKKKSSSVYQ